MLELQAQEHPKPEDTWGLSSLFLESNKTEEKTKEHRNPVKQ